MSDEGLELPEDVVILTEEEIDELPANDEVPLPEEEDEG